MRDHENRINPSSGDNLNPVDREQYRGNKGKGAMAQARDGYSTISVRDPSEVFQADEVPGTYKDADLDPHTVRKIPY